MIGNDHPNTMHSAASASVMQCVKLIDLGQKTSIKLSSTFI